MAWFDLTAAGIAVNGEEALPIRVEAGGRIELPPEAIPPWRMGWHLGSGAKDRDAERVTIVLARDVRQVPGSRAWQRLPRCYLTTH